MELESLRPIVSGVAGALVVFLLARASRKPARRVGARRVVQFGRGFRIFAALFLGFSFFVVYAAAHARPGQALLAATVATLFALAALYLAFVAFFVSIEYDEQCIHVRKKLLSGEKTIPWTDVASVRYSPILQAHYIETEQARRIWLSSMMQGFEELGDFLEKKHARLFSRPG